MVLFTFGANGSTRFHIRKGFRPAVFLRTQAPVIPPMPKLLRGTLTGSETLLHTRHPFLLSNLNSLATHQRSAPAVSHLDLPTNVAASRPASAAAGLAGLGFSADDASPHAVLGSQVRGRGFACFGCDLLATPPPCTLSFLLL